MPSGAITRIWGQRKSLVPALRRRFWRGPSAAARPAEGGTAGVAKMLNSLTPQQMEKIRKLAELRGDSFDRTLAHVVNYVGLKDVPSAYKYHYVPKDWEFTSLVVEGAYNATIALKNGRILTGYRSDARFQRFYRCVSDLMPAGVEPETYEVYTESYRRYGNALRSSFAEFLPPKGAGGVMVDAGAYIGFKGLGYADYLGAGGRTIMIEIDPVSQSIARRNIEQNGLGECVQSFCCAIWSENRPAPAATGVPTASFDRVRNSLVAIDEHPTWTVNHAVATRTLDSIFHEAGVEEIDFLNMQLNGAEIDALDGLVDYFDKVRVIYGAAGFHANGAALNAKLADKLAKRGCWVKKATQFVLAVTPRYRAAFKLR
jgi:FkbM family methyltransferase